MVTLYLDNMYFFLLLCISFLYCPGEKVYIVCDKIDVASKSQEHGSMTWFYSGTDELISNCLEGSKRVVIVE